MNSKRNIGLLDPIAEAFVKAVLQFCEDPDLCYTWPEFLPSLDEHREFWSDLNERIRHHLSEKPILSSRHDARLRKLNDVFLLKGNFKDESNDPLLDDETLDPFLSGRYHSPCRKILRQYGLKSTHSNLVVELLQRDLDSSSSRVRSNDSEKWPSALAQRLYRIPASRLQRCELLPLRRMASGSQHRSARHFCPPLMVFQSRKAFLCWSWILQQSVIRIGRLYTSIWEQRSCRSPMYEPAY